MSAKRKLLGQFYTKDVLSELMAEKVYNLADGQSVSAAVDFAAGEGALLEPISRLFPSAKIHAFDLDKENIDLLQKKIPLITAELGDSTLLPQSVYHNKFTIAVGNPPFINTILNRETAAYINKTFGTKNARKGMSFRAEVAFIAIYLNSVKEGGIVSLILPESIVSGGTFKYVRNTLLLSLSDLSVLKIERNAFSGAEVDTYLVTGIKNQNNDDVFVNVGCTKNGDIIDQVGISKVAALIRMDYKYAVSKELIDNLSKRYKSVGEVLGVITRGQRTKQQLDSANESFFHSTCFKENQPNSTKLEGKYSDLEHHPKNWIAKKNDVLIPRVGKRCHLDQCVVSNGAAVITDSILKIRVNSERLSLMIYETLFSDAGKAWRNAHTKGSCTKLLSQTDMLQLPIIGLPR